MTLRKKTLWVMLVALAALMATLYAVASTILSASFYQLERVSTESNVRRALAALSERMAGLNKSARDYAAWDDTYAFVVDGNQQYIESNLVDDVFFNLEINLALYVDTSGRIVYSKAIDLAQEVEIDFPDGVDEYLSADSPLLSHEDITASTTGILMLPDGPMLVASQPILTSAYTGPMRGTLVFGRFLDARFVEELANVTQLGMTIRSIDDPQLLVDFRQAASALQQTEEISIVPLSDDSIAGYSLLNDLKGRAALVLRVDTPRPIFQQAQASLRAILGSLAAIGFAFTMLILVFMERTVLLRLARLTGAVGRASAKGALSELLDLTGTGASLSVPEVESRDEVDTLARAFNTLVSQQLSLIRTLEQRVEARTAQLKASADVGRAAASILDPNQLMREVVNLITDRFGFYYAAVFTLDEAGAFAVLREATGEAGRALKERGHKLEVGGKSMVGTVAVTRRPRIALDVGTEPIRFANPLLPDTRSEIALPLAVGERVLGALDVQSTQEAAFDEASASLLQAMADQIAIAIDNATSYSEAGASARRARALYAASQQVGRLEVDLSLTVENMLSSVAEPLDYERWWVVALDESREWLAPLAAMSESRRPMRVSDQPDNPVVRSALQGETHIINDPLRDPRRGGFPEDQHANLRFLSVPIHSRGKPIGALAFGRPLERPEVTERDAEAGRSLAGLIAIAIENRSLFEQTRHALSDLDALNRRLTGEAWATFSRRLGRDGAMWIGTGAEASQSPLPEVLEAQTSGRIAARPADAGRLGVAVPVRLRGEPIGVLRLVVPESSWNNEMAATLDTIAGHVAQAAENARLIETAEARARRERALTESTDRVRRKADMERILQTAAEELARHLGAARVAVRLGVDDGRG